MAGWSLLGKRLAEFEVEIDGQKRRCSFALVSKVRNYGGDFEIARSVTPVRRPVRGGAVRRAVVDAVCEVFCGSGAAAAGRDEGGDGVKRLDGLGSSSAERSARVRADRWGVRGHLPAEIRIVPGRADAAGSAGVRSVARHRGVSAGDVLELADAGTNGQRETIGFGTGGAGGYQGRVDCGVVDGAKVAAETMPRGRAECCP